MHSISSYSYIKVNEEISQGVFEWKYYCMKPDGLPFLIGNEFIREVMLTSVPQTAINYISDTFLLLTSFDNQVPPVSYMAPTNEIRLAIRKHIQEELGWHVQPHTKGNFVIRGPETDNKTGEDLSKIKINTLHNRVISWKMFYKFAITNKYYLHENPLDWVSNKITPRSSDRTQMPPKSGMTKFELRKYWDANTYFCVIEDDSEIVFIDEPTLPEKLFKIARNLDRAIYIILRILFEGGPRIHEVLFITIGDWRKLHGIDTGANAINKGSRFSRVKKIHWTIVTERIIRNYIGHERRKVDKLNRGLDELPDDEPLFLNRNGKRISRSGFYQHFCDICQKANISSLTIHQIRHWFVTSKLRNIYELVDKSKRESYREKFKKYMGWKSEEIMKRYDHYLGQISDEEFYGVVDKEYTPKNRYPLNNRVKPVLTPEAIARNIEFQNFLEQKF